ncbi:MAG: response regulator transcription factor [Bdellovibrionales bacterium]|nr:response regulator transcription factor [Bdellovibrionales bacterium]
MKPKILIVEDSKDYQLMLKAIIDNNFHSQLAENGSQALDLISKSHFDLIIIDIVLPDMSGLQICSYVKSQNSLKDTPVILLTSKDTVDDKVKGLDSGADDYITKPFDFKELDARIRSQLRRKNKSTDSLYIPGLEINLDKQTVYVPFQDKTIDLTRIEFKLLVCFSQRIEHVLSRQQILDIVWPNDLNISERTVDSHISNLRKKLLSTGIEILAVSGSGYKFTTIKKSA